MSDDFPKLDGGWCDGLGCSGLCWCGERLAMKEEFQRVFNKPWKESYDKNPDIDCDRVDHLVRFSTGRIEKHFEKEIQNKQAEINRLKKQLAARIVVYQKETDGALYAKRCEDDGAVNVFIRENDLCVNDRKVTGGGWILTQHKSSKMWFYKKAEQK
jgi:hypothetical protein